MKFSTILVVLLLIQAPAFAQNIARVMIDGQIIVPAGDDVAGIVIYNKTSERGTITSEEGTFDIAVARNDEVVIQSVQFAPITAIIDQGIINSRQMNVTLRETVNELDEIIVRPNELTGDIVADVNRVRTIDPVPFDGSDIRMEDTQYDRYSAAENVAIDDQRWRYGLNFVNIFKAVFKKSDDGTVQETAEEELAEMYSNTFFQNNLDIKKENIGLYMDYVAANGLTKEMLEQGNELALIQFLLEKRDAFNKELAASKN
ncbi:hypothetical protein [Leeuwenhoekiella blandensis]|uniref:hypothetical protein n=1 Tax=Leeuwenhoekiella blandensis TaxID=360293 RepID=UPI002354732A|nr:hypothetical protein [Leeuwenhoekiella blandensis]|tara:strand:- start:7231 stop:8007 length:777 start_codon:yes stop_codon:yes gene_type:complete